MGKEADRREEKEVCTGVKSRVRQKSETVGEKKKKKKKTHRGKRSRQGREKRNTSTTKRVEEMTEIGREK